MVSSNFRMGGAMVELANSTFLDFTSWGSYDLSGNPTAATAYGLNSQSVVTLTGTAPVVTLAITLPRADEAAVAAFQAANWGERQQIIAELNADGQLWSVFGADPAAYGSAIAALASMGIVPLTEGYVSTVESRTIWVSLSPDQFSALFGTNLLMSSATDGFYFYEGSLTLPDAIAASGVMMGGLSPATQNLASTPVQLETGAQSEGNTSSFPSYWTPQQIADGYNFPLTGDAAVTGTLGLIEPHYGTAMPTDATQTFEQAVASYLEDIGISAVPTIYSVADAGQEAKNGNGERSLDVGVVSAVNPYSTIGVYAGSGVTSLTVNSVFAAYQAAIWDLVYNPSVLSSSFAEPASPAPGSPFYQAYQDLFLDAALRNISFVVAAGDGGSGGEVADGVPNLELSNASPYTLMVGGTSLSTTLAASGDSTISNILDQVQAGDLDVIWNLAVGGLKTAPGALSMNDLLLEVVWNSNVYSDPVLSPGFNVNTVGAGGIDNRSGVPLYQQNYGLGSYDGVVGRGVPDVAANSAGNMVYVVPDAEMDGTLTTEGGTSASAPLWASLLLQFNTIFADQGLPQLGFAHDLLYTASAIAPASFNDVLVGNNISSYISGGSVQSYGSPITPTGIGYEAGAGYDLTTGLGSPNGVLLARALSAIAHSQLYFADVPDVLNTTGGAMTESGANQTLLFQSAAGSEHDWSLDLGGQTIHVDHQDAGAYAWTSRFAQQSLQSDFSSDLVTLFDTYSQGALYQSGVASGASVGVTIGTSATVQPQINLTSAFGFVDFATETGSAAVSVARPVAIAETAGGADDQDAVVRIRQNGTNESYVTFYEVDDLNGTIAGLAPGAAGYGAAVAGRAYQTAEGQTAIGGAGYGQYNQSEILGVDAGDLIAMSLTSGGSTYYAFAQANEQMNGENVGHLWNYGLNTWGWEDLYGGGDRDFNDLVVQLDFTSAAGSGFLI